MIPKWQRRLRSMEESKVEDQNQNSVNQSQKHSSGERIESPRPAQEQSAARYDVIYGPSESDCRIEPHFCREWEGDLGCYGSNPDHGFTWEDARQHVVDFYTAMATLWQTRTEDWL